MDKPMKDEPNLTEEGANFRQTDERRGYGAARKSKGSIKKAGERKATDKYMTTK